LSRCHRVIFKEGRGEQKIGRKGNQGRKTIAILLIAIIEAQERSGIVSEQGGKNMKMERLAKYPKRLPNKRRGETRGVKR